MRDKKRWAGFTTILTALLVGMTFALVNSTYAASEEKNAVIVKAAVVHPVVPPKVLVFHVFIKEPVEKVKVEQADSKALLNRNVIIRNPFFVRNPFNFEEPFFFEEAFEEFE